MANDYEELEWSCPKCTFYNPNITRTCSMCNYEFEKNFSTKTFVNKIAKKFDNVALNGKNFNQNQSDSTDTNNNNNKKYKDVFKSTFNSLSNDVKNFINGFNQNTRTNQQSRADLDDSVIEIDPRTNDPIKTVTKGNIWACKTCTFAANPEWAHKCEICSTKRLVKNLENQENRTDTQKINHNKINSNNNLNADITVYDNSLNEDIYDYARIWTCKECTYINFERDNECELCLTPRSNKSSILNDVNGLNKQNKSSPNVNNNLNTNTKILPKVKSNTKNDKWICKMCTYLNSSTEQRCILCNCERNKSNQRPDSASSSSSWKCETCSHKNSSNSNKCEVCTNDKDHNKMDVDFCDYDNNYGADFENYSSYLNSHSLENSSLNPSLTYRSHKAKSLIKQYTNATNQAERIWKNIVKYCKENNHKFVDDAFPPCDKSLVINPSKKPDNLRNIQWLSPEYIRTHANEFNLKWTVYNEPKFNDIKQGLLGNCWLLSGLAVILEQPELLQRIIITKEYCPQGCYQVRLCQNGEWQTVILDDLFPCDSNGCLIYSQASRKQLWVPLIEKAMAKLNGSYESLIAGQTVEGLSALTGYPCDSIKLESSSSNEEEIDLEMIWAKLLSMKEAGYALGASCGRTDIEDDTVFTNQGLLPRHAYSVLAVKEVFGNRLIQLRNPWGRYTWTGDWSESSSKWTPELRKMLGLKTKHRIGQNQQTSSRQEDNHFYNVNRRNNDEGVFWISFYDFVQYFCSIDICKTRLDWLDSRVSGYFSPEGTREMQAFTLIVFETCEIDIGLFHKTVKNRRENSDLDLCFVILRSNGRKGSLGKLVVSSKRSIRRFVGCEHIFEPGEYLIVPCSFNFWYTTETPNMNNNLYNLVVHSPKVFYLEQEMYPAFLLADTIIQLCISQGNKTSSGLENACIYTLAKGYSGLIVVAENLNERTYLHVELDCERSNNVVSTRQALLTKDSVPPLHRQVLILLTQLEGSSSYSIQYSIKYRLSSNPYLNTWPGNEGRMVTNLPPINKQTFGLHAPRSVFN